MKFTAEGMELIKSFEGCKLEAYQDIVGVWTIGYGHTGKEVKKGYTITQEQADKIFEKDLKKFVDGVNNMVQQHINDNQFSALVSFAFNLGLGALGRSTLLECINTRKYDFASKEFEKWVYAGGKISNGLKRRRLAEKELFLKLT